MRQPSTVPIKYLETASDQSLESYELSRLNHASNLRKELVQLIDQWLEESAAAMLARWILEHRRQIRDSDNSHSKSLDNAHTPGSPGGIIPIHRRIT
jgi:hypothetical protein